MNFNRIVLCAALSLAACDPGGGSGDPAAATQAGTDATDDAADDANATTDGADSGCSAGGTSDACADTGEGDPTGADDDPTTADDDPTGGEECVDATAGLALDVAVNYPGADDPDYFIFSSIPCVAGEAALDLECQTAPDVTETISLVVDGTGQALPWASGDDVLLSTSWDLDEIYRISQVRIVVRSPDEALLLVASADSDEPNAAMIAPLTTSLDGATCSTGDDAEVDSHLGLLTYELEDSSLTLVGNDQGVLDTPTDTFAVYQQDSTVGPSKHTSVDLTFVMVRIDA